jgi:hypothetical protein
LVRNKKAINSEKNVLANWWRKSGHRVMIEDIDDLLQSQTEIVVLGKGKPGLLTGKI